MKQEQKYDVTLHSFINTDGTVHDTPMNTFNAVVDSKAEASVIVAMAYNDAGQFFSQFQGFEVAGLPKSFEEPELHMTISIAGRVVCKFDAVPVVASKARTRSALDSFVVPGPLTLN